MQILVVYVGGEPRIEDKVIAIPTDRIAKIEFTQEESTCRINGIEVLHSGYVVIDALIDNAEKNLIDLT